MGKKVLRKARTSKGERNSVSQNLVAATRAENRKSPYACVTKIDAWKNLQNPWITIENPSTTETNKRFIKVRANDYYGSPKPPKD